MGWGEPNVPFHNLGHPVKYHFHIWLMSFPWIESWDSFSIRNIDYAFVCMYFANDAHRPYIRLKRAYFQNIFGGSGTPIYNISILYGMHRAALSLFLISIHYCHRNTKDRLAYHMRCEQFLIRQQRIDNGPFLNKPDIIRDAQPQMSGRI